MQADRSLFRSKSLGVRAAEADFARLSALAEARGKPLGEWCREQLLMIADSANGSPQDQILLAEILALRTIIGNLLYQFTSGERPITSEFMKGIIDRADSGKHQRAAELLARTRRNGTTDENRRIS